MDSKQIKSVVKEKYSAIAQNNSSCCGSSNPDYTTFKLDYSSQKGYFPEADLGLGCGLPTKYAGIKKGDTVLDLGSGAGNDCFVARNLVGEKGRVVGIDFSEAMVERATANATKLGFSNVKFFLSEIEEMRVPNSTVDVVISNCVVNLVPDKQKVFSEVFRVLKGGGHFSISDIVLYGVLPEKLKNAAEMYCGCVSGALQKQEYIEIVKAAGFKNVKILDERVTPIPEEDLLKFLTPDEVAQYRQTGARVLSVNLYGEKPGKGCCCC